MMINYLCPFAQPNGVARAAHDYCMALRATGVGLRIIPIFPCDTDELDPHYRDLAELATAEWPKGSSKDYWVIHAMPRDALDLADDLPECAARVLVTTWETNGIPPHWVGPLDAAFDGIITPSQRAAMAFRGYKYPALVVPHALHPMWTRAKKVFGRDTDPYTFYSIGAWGERKNLLGLIKAYWAEFGADESVKLVIKTDRVDRLSLAALRAGTNLDSVPSLDLITIYGSMDDVLRLHLDYDCYVTASRGEGWNLGAFEACAVGNPVIATGWGGHTEFVRETYAPWHVLARYTMTPAVWTESSSIRLIAAGGAQVEMDAVEMVAPKGISARQQWAQPDLSDLQRSMRAAYASKVGRNPQHRDLNPASAAEARAKMEDDFGYPTVGRKLVEAIETCGLQKKVP